MSRGTHDSRLRLRRIFDKSNALIEALGDKTGRVVQAEPHVTKRNRQITYSLRIKGALTDPAWEFELAEILFHTRALLDNLTWDLATSDPTVSYTPRQERFITFPVSASEETWRVTVRSKEHLKRMPPDHLARIRSLQPFDALLRPDAVLNWVDALHQVDKHRERIRIVPGLDTQWPMLFRLESPDQSIGRYEIDWLVDENIELRSKLIVARVRTENAIRHAPMEQVPFAHFVSLEDHRYDLQDFLWDVQALALRAYEVMQGLDGVGFTALQTLAEFRRERLRAFGRMMTEGSDEWERLYKDVDVAEGFQVPY